MEAILVPLGLFAMIFGLVFGVMYLRYRRDMALIQHGFDPRTLSEPSQLSREFDSSRLERALTLTGIGLALTIGLGFIGFGPWLLGGLIPLFIGLSRLLALLISRGSPEKADEKESIAVEEKK
ncbi:MAG TPA: hypothetical protein DD435_10330 [Cyanobacteria bacterium UBA8530]|nr:hypothetical protein [Cyanobacteria bacterium UBA8530]